MIRSPYKFEGFDFTKLAYADWTTTLAPSGWTKIDLGLCSDGVNHIYAITLGALTSKPVIFIEGSIHGAHEWRCGYWIRKLAEMLTDQNSIIYPLAQELKSIFDFYFIPTLNPYGYINNTYTNANQVNLNRNFPRYWDSWPGGPIGGDQYKGPSAGSEPETQIVMSVINQYKPFVFVDCHTWGGFNGMSMEPADNTFKTMFESEKQSFEMDTVGNSINITYTTTYYDPRSTLWATSIQSNQKTTPITLAIEPGSLEINTIQSKYGVNYLLKLFMYAAKYYKSRQLR